MLNLLGFLIVLSNYLVFLAFFFKLSQIINCLIFYLNQKKLVLNKKKTKNTKSN